MTFKKIESRRPVFTFLWPSIFTSYLWTSNVETDIQILFLFDFEILLLWEYVVQNKPNIERKICIKFSFDPEYWDSILRLLVSALIHLLNIYTKIDVIGIEFGKLIYFNYWKRVFWRSPVQFIFDSRKQIKHAYSVLILVLWEREFLSEKAFDGGSSSFRTFLYIHQIIFR